jgi:hypothetical protein
LRFIVEAKKWCEEKGFRGLDTPVFVRWCKKHQRYEWCDPFSKVGGVAPDEETLRLSLIRHYKCSNCGSFHVYDIWFEGNVISFAHFLFHGLSNKGDY